MEHTPMSFAPRVELGMFEKAFGFAKSEDAFIVCAVNAFEKDQEIIRDLLKALKAQMQMRNMTKPTKLDEAMCWRDNDDLAEKWALEAITKAEGK